MLYLIIINILTLIFLWIYLFSFLIMVKSRLSFSPWTCELCSQEMDILTGNLTKYFKSINKFDLFCSFCTWEVLLTLEFQQIKTVPYIFSCIKGQTPSKYHNKSGRHWRGSQEHYVFVWSQIRHQRKINFFSQRLIVLNSISF